MTTPRESPDGLVVTDLAKSLRELVDWVEQIGCEAIREEDHAMLAAAKAALVRASQPAENHTTLDEVLKEMLVAGQLWTRTDPETGVTVSATVEVGQ